MFASVALGLPPSNLFLRLQHPGIPLLPTTALSGRHEEGAPEAADDKPTPLLPTTALSGRREEDEAAKAADGDMVEQPARLKLAMLRKLLANDHLAPRGLLLLRLLLLLLLLQRQQQR